MKARWVRNRLSLPTSGLFWDRSQSGRSSNFGAEKTYPKRYRAPCAAWSPRSWRSRCREKRSPLHRTFSPRIYDKLGRVGPRHSGTVHLRLGGTPGWHAAGRRANRFGLAALRLTTSKEGILSPPRAGFWPRKMASFGPKIGDLARLLEKSRRTDGKKPPVLKTCVCLRQVRAQAERACLRGRD
jgi:hypothetical protein